MRVLFHYLIILSVFFLHACSHKKVVQVEHHEIADNVQDDWLNAKIVTYHAGEITSTSYSENIDPLEPMNRVVFKFNKGFNNFLLKPVTVLYNRAIPEPGKRSVRNFLNNLLAPLQIIYGVLSLDGQMTNRVFTRFIINTTFGTLGIYDPASRRAELKFQNFTADDLFRKYGGKSGPYVVLPVLGPSSARGLLGLIFSFAVDPLNYVFSEKYIIIRSGLTIVDLGSSLLKFSDDINEISMDEYTAIKSIYLQNRR